MNANPKVYHVLMKKCTSNANLKVYHFDIQLALDMGVFLQHLTAWSVAECSQMLHTEIFNTSSSLPTAPDDMIFHSYPLHMIEMSACQLTH